MVARPRLTSSATESLRPFRPEATRSRGFGFDSQSYHGWKEGCFMADLGICMSAVGSSLVATSSSGSSTLTFFM